MLEPSRHDLQEDKFDEVCWAWVQLMGNSGGTSALLMNLFNSFFRREKAVRDCDLAKPYRRKAKEALLKEDLPMAVAYLDRGIQLVPGDLSLYLQRAQILQYGICDYTRALKDYRFILRELEASPEDPLVGKCKDAMKDMMGEPAGI